MQADAINGFRDFRRVPVFAGGGVGARLVVVVKEVQYAAQVGDDAVVHVGRGDSDVAQGRRAEFAIQAGVAIGARVRHQAVVNVVGGTACKADEFGIARHADVVIVVVAEGFFGAARRFAEVATGAVAARGVKEDLSPAFFLRGGRRLALPVAVVFAVVAAQRRAAFVSGDGVLEFAKGACRLVAEAGFADGVEDGAAVQGFEVVGVLCVFFRGER